MIPLLPLSPLLLLPLISSFLPTATPSTLFNFTSFTPNTPRINFSGDNVIELTRNSADGSLLESSGYAVYATPIQLWDPATLAIADFTTHFQFIIKALHPTRYGDGLAFFIAPVATSSRWSWPGLFDSTTNNSNSTRLVAVEFDTHKNPWDPDDNHIGIDVNSVVSNVTVTWAPTSRTKAPGRRGSGTTRHRASSSCSSPMVTTAMTELHACRTLNLREILPERVIIGFSTSTGG